MDCYSGNYIKVLWKRKWIVILVTLAAVIGAGIMSFFVLKPVYQARTVLLIPKFAPAVVSKGMTIEEYINLQTLTPQTFSPETYIGLLKSSSLEEKVIDALDLRTPLGEKLSLDELEKMMVAEPVKDADLIEMKVESSDPKIAKEIANTWTQLFVEENKESSIQDTVSSENAIRTQFEIAKEELEKAEEEKKAFEEKSKIPVLEKGVSNKIDKIAEFKARLSEVNRSLKTIKAEIRIWLPELVNNEIMAYESRLADIRLTQLMQEWETKKAGEELKDQKEVLTLHKSITEDQYLNQLLAELTERKAISLSNLELESEQVNPLYQNLKQRLINLNISQDVSKEEAAKLEATVTKFKETLANLSQELSNNELEYQKLILAVNSNLSKMRKIQLGGLRSSMAKELERKLVNAVISIQSLLEEKKQLNENVREYSKELDELRTTLEAEKLKLTNLERAISTVKSTYNMLSQKLEDARIASTVKTGEVKIVSLATEPKYPIKPRKKQNVLIGGVLGLFVGVLGAFFVDYWEKDEEKGGI